MFVRCPLYFNHGPAAEMWSVVHFPRTRISTRHAGSSMPRALGKGLGNGASRSSRCEPGAIATSTSGSGSGAAGG
jgi:hypothetical protein